MTRKLFAPVLASLAALGLLFASPVAARPGKGGPDMEPTAEMKAVHALKKQIAAEELAAALNLSAEQKTQLSALIQQVVAAKDDAREARSELAAEAEPILAKYLREVQNRGEPSAATLEKVRALRDRRHEGKDGRKEAREGVRESLQSILSREQLETVAKFRPMSAVGPDEERQEARRERREKRRERVRDFAEENDIDPEALEELRDGKRKRGAKRKMRRTAHVLLSPEMLDVLSR